MKTKSMTHWKYSVFAVSLLSLSLGCGPKDDGRYDLSGSVTLDGQPVPVGELILEPDGDAGNKGPSSMTQISEGKYALPEDQGIVGGSYNLTIMAFDGVAFGEALTGKTLLRQPHVEKVEFPKEDSTHDFVINRNQ